MECEQCAKVLYPAQIALLERINANAEADMLAGNPITGAHHRAIEAQLKRLREEQQA